ncbi:MAG: hypothetical protein HY726_00210 [Candidatus Rokubacteria bacterium]|nr:hypothetical protein [Candidatus Rokubacteria bacterium]
MRISVRYRRAIALGLVILAGSLWSDTAFAQRQATSGEGVISQGNLFSPERRPWTPPPPPPPAKPEPPPAPKPEPPPQFVVYGVLIMGTDRIALLKEPKLTAGKVQEIVLGAQVGPYRLARVEADRVVLEKDGSSLTVAVDDPARPKGQVIALPGRAPQVPMPQPPAAPPSASPSGPEPSAAETLTDALSKFRQRLGLPQPTPHSQ